MGHPVMSYLLICDQTNCTGAADAHGEDGLPEERQVGRAADRAEAIQRS